ncbi:MAG: FAD-dependent oxidoreductase [bacterium]|nr:FAD-dependent oxidoreductase [bacterium]
MVVDVVVIGGGFAGVSAAVQLADAGLQVCLLEQKEHLGGRVYSVPHRETGDWIDNGQHVLMGCYHKTMALLRKLKTDGAVNFQKRLEVIYRGPGGLYDELRCPALPGPLHLLAGLANMKTLKPKDKWAAVKYGLALRTAGPRKNETVHQFASRMKQPLALRQRLWDPIALSALNEETSVADASLLAGVMKQGFMGAARDSRIGLPVRRLAALHGEAAVRYLEERGGTVRMGEKAASMEWRNNELQAVMLASGERLPCRFAISAATPEQLRKVLLRAGLETLIRLPQLGESSILSVYLWFDSPIASEAFCCLQNCTFEWAFHRANFMEAGEHSSACVCLVASAARRLQGLTRDEIVRRAMDDLQRVYPDSTPAAPVLSSVFWEPRATFSCTPANEAKRPLPPTALKNFFLAGDWTQTGLPATIEGAVVSGINAARELLSYKRKTEKSRF